MSIENEESVTRENPREASARQLDATRDQEVINAVKAGDTDRFSELVDRYSPRLFAVARRHARQEQEVADIVQEIFLKAFHRLASFRGDAPFEHWLMRLAVHTCYDFLRKHQRNREHSFTDLGDDEHQWLENFAKSPEDTSSDSDAARRLVQRIFEELSPPARMVLTLLELEDRTVKEIADLTGWSLAVVKVRAFRARAEMKKILKRLRPHDYI